MISPKSEFDYELFEAAQRGERRAGVDRADPAGMAGAPGLQSAITAFLPMRVRPASPAKAFSVCAP